MSDQDAQTALRQEEVARERGEMPGSPKTSDGMELEVDTAFVVFVQNGVAFATTDIGDVGVRVRGYDVSLRPARRASPGDLYRYATEVAKDVQVEETARSTASYLAEELRLREKRVE